MDLRQQIVQSRIETLSSTFGISQQEAFLRLSQHLVSGQNIHDLDPSDIVDGHEDKQIDVISIEEGEKEAIVYIIQVKFTESFSSNTVIQMQNGLNWIFTRPKVELEKLSNIAFKDKVLDYRSTLAEFYPSNTSIVVAYVTNGHSKDASKELKQEIKSILDSFDNDTFKSFKFQLWGCDEIVEKLNEIERRDRRIDAKLSIRYDANSPSLIKYFSEGLKGVVCTVSAKEIARIVNNDDGFSIFDANIRQFLGSKGSVNSEILNTCSDSNNSYLFWFLNNGITIVCDEFEAITVPENPHIAIKNLLIINGCQTATSLALAEREKKLVADTRVLLRIYQTTDPELISKIVMTTNNQNKIESRDLRANDSIQIDMQAGFAQYGYFYERKTHQYDGDAQANLDKLVVNDIVGQAYLANVLKIPSDARRRKYKIWHEYYERIFSGHSIEPHVLSVQIYLIAKKWQKISGNMTSGDDVRRKLVKNGVFHLTRIASYLWRGSDDWRISIPFLKTQITELENNPEVLHSFLEEALSLLEKLIQQDESFSKDIDATLKSASFDDIISRYLNKNYPKSTKVSNNSQPKNDNLPKQKSLF